MKNAFPWLCHFHDPKNEYPNLAIIVLDILMIFNKVSLKSKPWVKRHHITNCSIVVPVYKGDYQGFNVWLALLAEHKLGEVESG